MGGREAPALSSLNQKTCGSIIYVWIEEGGGSLFNWKRSLDTPVGWKRPKRRRNGIQPDLLGLITHVASM